MNKSRKGGDFYMSLQSDTEMLSVSAVEEYATQNHMTVDATYELFHRHQIFE